MSKKGSNSPILQIYKNKISLKNIFSFRALEIYYHRHINISTLLSQEYVVKKSSSKILIINLGNIDSEIRVRNFNTISEHKHVNNIEELDLLTYRGEALIEKCYYYNATGGKSPLFIDRIRKDFWNNLINDYTWESITTNWEDLNYDGNNNKLNVLKRTKVVDKEAKTTIIKKELRKE